MRTIAVAPTVDSTFVLDPFESAYLSISPDELKARVAAGHRELEDCCACPRNCHVNRVANQTKICNTGRYARVVSAFPHFGEEDCLRGWHGSGTIFFSLCNFGACSVRTGISVNGRSARNTHRMRLPT